MAGMQRTIVLDRQFPRLKRRAQQRFQPAAPIRCRRVFDGHSDISVVVARRACGLAGAAGLRTYRTMSRRTNRPRAYAPDPGAPGHTCDMPGCPLAGEYRAPKSRTQLREYLWFCLDHVRAYNAAWDFYKGMSPGQIEAHLREDTSWQRPTWPLGRLGGRSGLDEELLHDRLDILGAAGFQRAPAPAHNVPHELRQPLDTLGLPWPVSLDDLKARYKALAKRHHPDANGGDRAAEERLKTINLAYAALRSHMEGRATAPAFHPAGD